MPTVVHPDPFAPVLLNSPALPVTLEQRALIMEILETSSSDSYFALKAFKAIELVLTGGITKAPTLTSLVPNSAELGDPSFTLHVHGSNFAAGSVISFAGVDEPTTVVSATEVTTGVNMDVWLGPDVLPVYVRNASGVQSDPLSFTFTDGLAADAMGRKRTESTRGSVQTHVDKTDSPKSVSVTATKSLDGKK